MRVSPYIALLILGMARTTMAQPAETPRYKGFDKLDYLRTLNHIEVDLGQQNTLIVQFRQYSQVTARSNVDSVLRLFVADHAKVKDADQDPTRAAHALFRLGDTNRGLDLRYSPQQTTSFRFTDGRPDPVLVKTKQDTLRVVWSSDMSALSYYDFSVYMLVNNLSDIDRLLREGGVNPKLQEALKAVQQYKGHDLTSPKMAFDLRYKREGSSIQTNFISPGLARSPFISFQPYVGVGLIRNQWVPSLNLDLAFVPSRLHNVSYSVGYSSNFFFGPSSTGESMQPFRNDFVSVGVAFYHSGKDGRTTPFSRQIASFNVGMLVHRKGSYFAPNTIRLHGTIYQKGFLKIQPELYMNGFFKQVYPGVRIGFGL